MTLFDRYVVVDWSASATPKTGPDSVWIADLAADADVQLTNPSTRAAACDQIRDVLAESDGRTLIGFDASLGYPAGTADHFGFEQPGWLGTWHDIAQLSGRDERNRNNRFEVAGLLNARGASAPGPFWGCPARQATAWLQPTKPERMPVPEFRTVERRLRAHGRYPKSAWQLLGIGSVGSQTLTLLPYLERIREQIDVWPFTTGLDVPPRSRAATVVEIWPSLFDPVVPPGMVIDAAQVSETAGVLRDADIDGRLSRWFTPQMAERDDVVNEEGWVLGVS